MCDGIDTTCGAEALRECESKVDIVYNNLSIERLVRVIQRQGTEGGLGTSGRTLGEFCVVLTPFSVWPIIGVISDPA